MLVLTAAFMVLMSPLAFGFRFAAQPTHVQIADGIFRFSFFILNPSMVLAWLALPFFHRRSLADFGWRLLGLIILLLVGCFGAVVAIV
jgi:hypothetical protein